MKEKKDKLHRLIHLMNKSEKRYFQLFSKISGDSKNKKYLKIFDAMHQISKYDEQKFFTLLEKNNVSSKNIGSDKIYLYNQILKSLRIVNSSDHAKIEAREWMDICDILFSKGLYEQALQACRKAAKIVNKYNIISLKIDVLLTQRKVSSYMKKSFDNKKSLDEIIKAVNDINEFVEIDFLYRKSIMLLSEIGKIRRENEGDVFIDILNRPLLNKESSNIHSIIRKNQTLAVIHFSKGEIKDEYKRMENNLELMDADPDFKEENIYEYVIFYSHVLRLTKYIDYQNYPKLLEGFFELGNSIKKSKLKIKAQIYSLGYSTETVRFLERGLYEEGVALIPKIKALVKEYGNLVPRSVQITFEYKFAYFYFGLGNLIAALKYINNVINDYSENDRKDVFRYAKIFSLIIHYELGNYSLVSYNIRSLQSFLKKRNLLYSTENTIIQCLKKLIRFKHNQDVQIIFEETKEKIILDFEENPKNKEFLVFFDVLVWLESKIKNISFQEMKNMSLNVKED